MRHLIKRLLIVCAFSMVLGTYVPVTAQNVDHFKRQQTVPYKFDIKGRLLLPIEFDNGKTALFLMDSGASSTTLYRDQARLMGMQRDYAKGPVIITSTGRAQSILFKPGAFSFGIHKRGNRSMPAIGNSQGKYGTNKPVGVLGLDLLLWQVYEVDPKEKEFHFYKFARHFEQNEEWQQVQKGGLRGNAIFVKINLNGVVMDAMIDTGASRTVLNKTAVQKVMDSSGENKPKVRDDLIRIHGEDGRTSAVSRVITFDAALPLVNEDKRNIELGQLELLEADLPAFRAIGYGDKPFMLLGMDILRGRSIVIDMRDSRLFVKVNI